VRLGVRAQAQAVPLRKAGHGGKVALQGVEVDHQGRRVDRRDRLAVEGG
jgi:hypothetical protein